MWTVGLNRVLIKIECYMYIYIRTECRVNKSLSWLPRRQLKYQCSVIRISSRRNFDVYTFEQVATGYREPKDEHIGPKLCISGQNLYLHRNNNNNNLILFFFGRGGNWWRTFQMFKVLLRNLIFLNVEISIILIFIN